MPLGKLSQQQITRGFEALEELEAALREQPPRAARLEELSSRFYTIVPHNFGRARPPPIDSPDLLRAKKDMLLVRCCPASGDWHPSPWGREAVPWQGPWSPVTASLLGPCQVLADIEVAQSAGAEGGGRGGGGCPPPGPGLRPALLPAFPAGPGLPGAPGAKVPTGTQGPRALRGARLRTAL